MSNDKPKQSRTAGRKSPMVNITLSPQRLGRLESIMSRTSEGKSAIVSRLIDAEYAAVIARAAPRVAVAKGDAGWTVFRFSPADGIEILSEGHKSKKAAEKAAESEA